MFDSYFAISLPAYPCIWVLSHARPGTEPRGADAGRGPKDRTPWRGSWWGSQGQSPVARRRLAAGEKCVQTEGLVVGGEGERPAVALDDRTHAAGAEPVVEVVALGGCGQPVGKAQVDAGVAIVLHVDRGHARALAHDERDRAQFGVGELAHRLDRVVEGVAKERVEVRGCHEVEGRPVGDAGQGGRALLAEQALLGEDGVKGLVAGADQRVVHVDLARKVVEDGVVHGRAAVRQVPNLVAKVVALDVDRLDVGAGQLVLALALGEEALCGRLVDVRTDVAEDQVKNYLEPDSVELEILQYINDNFDNGIVVVNSAVVVELGWLEQFPNIKTVILVPSLGTDGIDSFAGVLTGEINPSGRTVDTFAADALGSPAAQNFGDYQYVDEDGNLTQYNYVSYAEGIYVGYKYYETRYEDSVLGQGNAGDYDYDSEVVLPFGYGLSYTTFEWTDFSTSWDGDTCTATVTVTNTGDVAGKDVVELYAQSPYTDYDVQNGVEKASVQLVGYEKTSLLEPGQSETVTITFAEDQLKAYDANGAGTYILDAGTYYVAAATDAHAAVNNVLAAKGAEVDGAADMVDTYVPANTEVDTTKYATDSYSGAEVGNLFDDAAGDVEYLTRSDWEGTFPEHDGTALEGTVSTWGNEINGEIDGEPASLLYVKTASDELLAQLDSYESGNPTDDATLDDEIVYGADNGLTLIDMRGLDYDDAKWDLLLDQLTLDDYNEVITRGGYGTPYLESVQKPFNTDADTAAYLIYGGTGYVFAGPLMLAQTWNQELAYDYGEMFGNEALLGGATGWYAPSMNIHRSPFSGRNGEYYSEDAFLSGVVGSQSIYGAASKGLYSTIKHFALNDQEDHRGDTNGQLSIATWANEQSIREIYLRPFEMCMKVGDVELNYVQANEDGTYENATRTYRAAQGVMTSFNRIGATWTGGSYSLLTGILRTEWDFDGWVITDAANSGTYMDAGQMIRAGGDVKLTYLTKVGNNWRITEDSSADYHYAREALHHLLYVTANSNVMNGSMPGSELVYHASLSAKLRVALSVVSVAGIGLIGWTGWRNHKKRAAERAEAAE